MSGPAGHASPFPRCAAATRVEQACVGLVDDLIEGGTLPSVYLLIDGRLRCQAARGYFQVVDGFTPGRGVIGRVVESGRPQIIEDVSTDPEFIAAVPGLVAEACAPVRVYGRVVGAVNVESMTSFPADIGTRLAAAATELGARIEALGGMPPVPLAQRLARIAVGLTALTDSAAIVERAVAGAIEISTMTSSALSRRGSDGRWSVAHAAGPLAGTLRQWSQEDHCVVAAWGGPGTSSHFPGGVGVPVEYQFLLRAGVQTIAVQPLFLSDQLIGLLTTADTRPVAHDPTIGAAIELLAAQTAACLGMGSAIEELRERAARDPLTRLRNAGAFVDDMDRAAGRESTACLLIDVDDFKAINDTYGHLVGDQLLCDLADQLRANLRGQDVLYRIGGDEFAAILPDTAIDEAARVARRLVDAARGVRTTISIGMAMVGEDGPLSARLRADRALYEAKDNGRNRVEIGSLTDPPTASTGSSSTLSRPAAATAS